MTDLSALSAAATAATEAYKASGYRATEYQADRSARWVFFEALADAYADGSLVAYDAMLRNGQSMFQLGVKQMREHMEADGSLVPRAMLDGAVLEAIANRDAEWRAGNLVPRERVDALVAAWDAYSDCLGECAPLGGNNVTCRGCVERRALRAAIEEVRR